MSARCAGVRLDGAPCGSFAKTGFKTCARHNGGHWHNDDTEENWDEGKGKMKDMKRRKGKAAKEAEAEAEEEEDVEEEEEEEAESGMTNYNAKPAHGANGRFTKGGGKAKPKAKKRTKKATGKGGRKAKKGGKGKSKSKSKK